MYYCQIVSSYDLNLLFDRSKIEKANGSVSQSSDAVPERSSRLRQVKSSYRRFLHQLGPHHASNKSDKG